jgi:hypothetical protein
MTLNTQTKEAEEKWSLHQCNPLEDSRKTATPSFPFVSKSFFFLEMEIEAL